jgi:hypothetical protein
MARSPTPLPSQERGTFASVLDTPMEDIERPKPMPVGQYIWVVKGQPESIKSREKQTPGMVFILSCLEAVEDTVDQDALEQWLTKKDGTKKPLQEVTQKLTFWLTEGSAWGMKDFVRHCGIDGEGMSLRQAISETPGCQVVGTIKHRASDDGQATFAFIDSTAPVE